MQWSEPAVWREQPRGEIVDAATRALVGLEQLRAMRTRPGLYHLTGTTLDSAAPREAVFSMPVTGWLLSAQGAVPGGVLAIPGDGALGCSIHTELAAGSLYTTAELSMTYLRPVRVGGRVRALGRALHVGRTLAFSVCDLVDDRDVLLAHASSRCFVFPTAPGAPARGGTATPPLPSASAGGPSGEVDPFAREPVGSVLDQSVWDRMSGLEVLREQIAGGLPAPPMHHLFGITPTAADDGAGACVMPVTGWLATPWGWPQGGFIALLADAVLAMAVQTTIPRATAFAPVDLKVNYLRPAPAVGSLLHARATVVHRGRSLRVATGEITDEDGRLVAVATGSAQVVEGRPASLGDPAG